MYISKDRLDEMIGQIVLIRTKSGKEITCYVLGIDPDTDKIHSVVDRENGSLIIAVIESAGIKFLENISKHNIQAKFTPAGGGKIESSVLRAYLDISSIEMLGILPDGEFELIKKL